MTRLHTAPATKEKEPESGAAARAGQKTPADLAAALADAQTEFIGKHQRDYEEHVRSLHDLKFSIVKECADMEKMQAGSGIEHEDLLWSLAHEMPDFNTESLYQKRQSLTAIGAAVFLGWIIGGILSALLDFVSLGGDILRALAIFGAIWLGEFISSNPRARHILLACLGFGALARFAAALASGIARITSFSWLRNIIFGAGPRPNIFKCVWLAIGAFFIFIFLSKKISALDLAAFNQSLRGQIEERIGIIRLILKEIAKRDKTIACLEKAEQQTESAMCPKDNCQLASAVIGMLDSLDASKQIWLSQKLAAAGYAPDFAPDDNGYLIWNSQRHSQLYDTIGIINEGDRCRILKRAHKAGDRIIKGHAQRLQTEQPHMAVEQ